MKMSAYTTNEVKITTLLYIYIYILLVHFDCHKWIQWSIPTSQYQITNPIAYVVNITQT